MHVLWLTNLLGAHADSGQQYATHCLRRDQSNSKRCQPGAHLEQLRLGLDGRRGTVVCQRDAGVRQQRLQRRVHLCRQECVRKTMCALGTGRQHRD